MRNTIIAISLLAGASIASAQDFIRPISNPVWHGPAATELSVHPIFMYHALPKKLDTQLGKVPAGGDVEVYALQFEIPLAKRLSLIAVKDGYVDLNPDATLAKTEGMADLAAGLKYVLLQNEKTVVSARAVAELPIGDDKSFQGNGNGLIAPAVTCASLVDNWQLGGTFGAQVGLDSEQSDELYYAIHVSYALTEAIHPVIELNDFYTLDAGDGGNRFDDHVGGAVPAVANFEGGDLINLGAANADGNNFATLALGCRYVVDKKISVGAAYEFPLTDKEQGLMDYRVTADVTINL